MPVSVQCGECGKNLRAPDALAGKTAKCPLCGAVISVPGTSVTGTIEDEIVELVDAVEAQDVSPNRRPCPMCGEMIVATAVKCRFCGEVLDESAGSVIGQSKRQPGALSEADKSEIAVFRRNAHWTGGFIIFFAFVFFLVAASIGGQRGGRQPEVLRFILLGMGLGWLVLGVCLCRKQLWAAYVLGVLSALSMAGNLMQRNLLGAFFAGAIALECYQITKFGRALRDRGIPLNTRELMEFQKGRS